MVDLRLGDCLELMKDIPDGSVDLVLIAQNRPTTRLFLFLALIRWTAFFLIPNLHG